MTDDDRIFALADMRFPSLDALHAWFSAQIAGTKDEDEKVDLRLADQIATARHIRRAKAAADVPIPHPPPAPKPPPEPLPSDASEDEKAARMYGPSLTRRGKSAPAPAPPPGPGNFRTMEEMERYYGRLIKQAGDDVEKVHELEVERGEAIAAFVSDEEAAVAMYGTSVIGGGFPVVRPKQRTPPPDNEKAIDPPATEGVK